MPKSPKGGPVAWPGLPSLSTETLNKSAFSDNTVKQSLKCLRFWIYFEKKGVSTQVLIKAALGLM